MRAARAAKSRQPSRVARTARSADARKMAGGSLLFQLLSQELEDSLCRLIGCQAEFGVDRAVSFVFGRDQCSGDAGVLEGFSEELGLSGRIGPIGDVENKEGRDRL